MNAQPVKPSYLVIGVLFVAAALMWAFDAGNIFRFLDAAEFWPIALIAAGALGVAASVRSIVRGEGS